MRFSRFALVLALGAIGASAAVIQTTGTGSAVAVVNGSAAFESTAALYDNPYSEGGMLFSRTGLSFNNNGCGYAGCYYNSGFAGFSGNYMYGVGSGYFIIAAGTGTLFRGLEFVTGSGYSEQSQTIVWEAYNGSTLVGSGSVNLPMGAIIGFSDPSGFDSLHYTDNGANGQNAPAFDTVRAQFDSVAVPEPSTLAMATLATLLFGAFRRRRA